MSGVSVRQALRRAHGEAVDARVVRPHEGGRGGRAGRRVERELVLGRAADLRAVTVAVVEEQDSVGRRLASEVLAAKAVERVVDEGEVAVAAELPDHVAGGGVDLPELAHVARADQVVAVGGLVDGVAVGLVERVVGDSEERGVHICRRGVVERVPNEGRAAVRVNPIQGVANHLRAGAAIVGGHVHDPQRIAENEHVPIREGPQLMRVGPAVGIGERVGGQGVARARRTSRRCRCGRC